jgi:hypothetical protein
MPSDGERWRRGASSFFSFSLGGLHPHLPIYLQVHRRDLARLPWLSPRRFRFVLISGAAAVCRNVSRQSTQEAEPIPTASTPSIQIDAAEAWPAPLLRNPHVCLRLDGASRRDAMVFGTADQVSGSQWSSVQDLHQQRLWGHCTWQDCFAGSAGLGSSTRSSLLQLDRRLSPPSAMVSYGPAI